MAQPWPGSRAPGVPSSLATPQPTPSPPTPASLLHLEAAASLQVACYIVLPNVGFIVFLSQGEAAFREA